MKSSKVLIKRSSSPIEPPKTIQISDRKKKSSSNAQLQNPYKKVTKQFETSNKTQKKRNNYLQQLLRSNGQSTNKYRIVTQPVQQKLLYLGNNNYGNGNNLVFSNSRSKLESHHQYAQRYLKLNIRTNQHSKEKLRTGDSFHKDDKIVSNNNNNNNSNNNCKNCHKYKEQLEYIRKEINRISMDKVLWKNGQMHLQDITQSFFKLKKPSNDKLSQQNFVQNLQTKMIDNQISQIKKHFLDLMKDIQSMSSIDYPKMLSLNIFKHDPFYSQSPSSQQTQLKSLLSQVRLTYQGKIPSQQLQDIYEYNSSQNQYSKKIYRNLKNRLNHYLRENLELKLRKEILERSEEITNESEDYLRKVIQDVLLGYSQD